jgi:hypothetical protein
VPDNLYPIVSSKDLPAAAFFALADLAAFFNLIFVGFASFSEYLYPDASTKLPEFEATDDAVHGRTTN